jgi:predicted enzyme related to lactoylglutathione lyase
MDFPGTNVGILPHGVGEVGGCLFVSADAKPSEQGVMIYLNANGRLDDGIAAVVPNGGKMVQPKHPIGPFGFRAIIIDSEGNRVALHSD